MSMAPGTCHRVTQVHVFWQVGTTGDLQCWEFFFFRQYVQSLLCLHLKNGFSIPIFPSTFFCYFNFLRQVLLCSPVWPEAHYVAQVDSELKILPPLSPEF